jgi:pilus assembly protein CpaB
MWVRVLVLLVLAGGVGFGTIKVSQQWLESERAASANAVQQPEVIRVEPEYTHILVAQNDLAVGQFLKNADIAWQPWPEDAISPNHAVEGETTLEDYVGAVSRDRIGAGEPIVLNDLVRPGERGFLSAVLGPGMRAVTVPINPRSGIAGFIYPGDRVDMILTHRYSPLTEGVDSFDRAENRTVSETVLLDLRVLAIDQALGDFEQQARMGSLATLEVTPQQAEMINVLLELGSLSLSLRSLADPEQPGILASLANRGINPTLGLDVPESEYFGTEAQLQPILGRSVTYDSDVSQVLMPPILVSQTEPEVESEEPVAAPVAPLPAPVTVVETTIMRGSASPTARH